MLTKIENYLKRITPSEDRLTLFYWGTYIAFIGAMLYIFTHYLFFLWIPSLLYIVLKGFKSDDPKFWNFFYFIISTVVITTLVFSLL